MPFSLDTQNRVYVVLYNMAAIACHRRVGAANKRQRRREQAGPRRPARTQRQSSAAYNSQDLLVSLRLGSHHYEQQTHTPHTHTHSNGGGASPLQLSPGECDACTTPNARIAWPARPATESTAKNNRPKCCCMFTT